MPLQYSDIYNLDKLDVYFECDPNNPVFFEIRDLPEILSYGKHSFKISYSDPKNKNLRLKESSKIIFEFKDSKGKVITSDLTEYDTESGDAIAYVWVRRNPPRHADEITDGPATLTIVGELEGVPEKWVGNYNVRLTIPNIQIRKDYKNTSPVIFQNPYGIQLNYMVIILST